MADTSQPELSEPHTNGVMDGLTEEEKSKMRPADIDADMREMERRKRVEMMMNSRLFREELERIIETQMKDGSGPSGLLQQISDMMGAQGSRFNANVFKNSNCVVPINDIRGVESMGYAKGEKLLRCKLAAVFRLLDLYGWTQGVGGQITARLNQDQEHFLVNPYGLLYHEVTASSLVKVDMKGSVVEQGTTNFGVHVTGFQLHSTIHAARPDIKCIIHITTPTVTAISSLKSGLLPLGQESIVIGEVSTHQYMGESALEPEEREKITRNLGPINKVMLLTNRGALCCGETVEEAFYNVYNTVLACETQLKLMPAGLENLNLITEEAKKAIFEASRKGPAPHASALVAAAATKESTKDAAPATTGTTVVEPSPLAEKLEKRWRIGGTEFEALMRMLDNAGFRTGYIYRHPLIKGEPPRPRNDVEVPPAVSSLGYLLEEEELYKQGLWKGGRKGTDRSRWLNSPNVYQKIEIQETGTPDPKKITKWVDQNAEEWVSDGSPTHSSTPVKIESALQFVPKNTNPKEFKQLQQQIKDYRRADKISAGPQSHILEGVSWEEAKKMQDATISGTGEQVVLVGAASKGIIQRGFQHNAMVYKTPYAKNPFDAVTDQELDQYKKEVERKHKGDPYDESQSESEALSSFNVSRATHESSTAKSPIQSPVSVTSETEEESRDEPRVLRIETKQVPLPSQPEVVLSDAATISATVTEIRSPPQDSRGRILVLQESNRFPAQDATSQFLNEMRRDAVDPRNTHNSHKRDLLTSQYNSANEEGKCRSVTVKLHDVLDLIKVSTGSTVAEQVRVASNKSQRISSRSAASKNHLEKDCVDKSLDSVTSLRRDFFRDSYDKLRDNISINLMVQPNIKSGKLAEKIARFSQSKYSTRPVNSSDSPLQLSLHFPGYVRHIIDKYSSLSRKDSRDLTKDFAKRYSRIGRLYNESSDEIPFVGYKIQTTPEANFVEEVFLTKKTTANEENEEIVDSKLQETTFSTNNDDFSNESTIGFVKSSGDFNGNTSDENGNNWIETQQKCESQSDAIGRKNIETQSIIGENLDGQELEGAKFDKSKKSHSSEENVAESETKNQFFRQDSITDVINSMNGNINPLRVTMSLLPKTTNNSMKYELDSTKMGLFYSLTPAPDVEYDWIEKFNLDDISNCPDDENSSEDRPKSATSSVHDENSDFLWEELKTSPKRQKTNETTNGNARTTSPTNLSVNLNESLELLDCSLENDEDLDSESNCELCSNEGSDILELPMSTIIELEETTDESFSKDISTSANKIIAHLDDRELFVFAANLVDDIIGAVSVCLNDSPRDNWNEKKIETLKQRCQKILESSSNFDIVDNPFFQDYNQIHEAKNTTNNIDEISVARELDFSDDDEKNNNNNENNSRYTVINEIVHLIVDKWNNDESHEESDSFCSKRVKETSNIGKMREMRTNEVAKNYAIEDESSSIPSDENSYESDLSRCNNSPPVDQSSPEFHQERFSESTDNDTKSDDSKEKNCETSQESPRVSRRRDDRSIYFCLIEYVDDKVQNSGISEEDTSLLETNDFNSRDTLACIPEEIVDEFAEDSNNFADSYGKNFGDTSARRCLSKESSSSDDAEECDGYATNATYTVSECSDDDDRCCFAYNADISNSTDDTRQSLPNENEDLTNFKQSGFDTTAYLADVSSTSFNDNFESSMQIGKNVENFEDPENEK